MEPEKEKKEEEEDKLETFFCNLYEFHNPAPPIAPVFAPAELPPRYAINFVPAVSALPVSPVIAPAFTVNVASPVIPFAVVSSGNLVPPCPVVASSSASSDYSVVSSANFVPQCIETT